MLLKALLLTITLLVTDTNIFAHAFLLKLLYHIFMNTSTHTYEKRRQYPLVCSRVDKSATPVIVCLVAP